jgi:hypothetical protein
MRRLSILPFLLSLRLAAAQSPSQAAPPPALQLSPQAAYDQAVRPLDITRRSAANWSDAEIAALKIATAQAKLACADRTPDQFAGEDLLAYARLCAFGQVWLPVQQAASSYLIARQVATPEEQQTGFPNLATAFDYEVQASLQLKNPSFALATAQTMLRTVPYDELASEATSMTVRYIQLTDTDEAIALLAQRQPLILALIKAHAAVSPGSLTPVPASVAALPSAHPPLPLYALYADAIALPTMQQFDNQQKAAAACYAELEAALPAALAPDDAIFTAAARRQYQLLGAPLPAITVSAWLLDPAVPAPRDLNTNFGSATVFLLFPDWCNQCLGMGPIFAPAAKSLSENHARFFGLLAQANAPPKPAPKEAVKAPTKPAPGTTKSAKPAAPGERPQVQLELAVKASAAMFLAGSPTIVVPNEILNTFVATDFPLIIVTDHNGIVRDIQLAPDNALVPGGLIDQVVYHVIDHWPPPGPESAQPK